jgi:Nucleotidyltransferase domain
MSLAKGSPVSSTPCWPPFPESRTRMIADVESPICADLDAVLRRANLSWAGVRNVVSEAVLFGSRAAGLARAESDWDLLLIGDGRPIRTSSLDLIWVDSATVWSEHWLGSELASHVAAHGQWLTGSGDWRHAAFVSREAFQQKKTAITFYLNELMRLWPHLHSGARDRHARRVRRDVQRLSLLHEQKVVPSTPILDLEWARDAGRGHDLRELFELVRAMR